MDLTPVAEAVLTGATQVVDTKTLSAFPEDRLQASALLEEYAYYKSLYPDDDLFPRQPQGMPLPAPGLTPGLYGPIIGMVLPSFGAVTLGLVPLVEA